jgi:NitT/TauT family transport system substrate-binding protein
MKMKPRFKKALMFLLVVLLAIMATPIHAQDNPEVKLGVQPWLGYGPWWIAEEQGYFADHGLDVEVIDFTWDQDMNAALASGQLDVEAAATNTLIALINQGVDAQAFLLLDASFEADAIIAHNDIETIEDLDGLEVAYEPGSTSDLLLNYALNEAGMSIEDVESIPIAASDVGVALIAGQVDVAVTYEPYISAVLRDRDEYHVLYTAAERPGLISDVMIAQREYIMQNPEVITGLALAWNDAITYLRDNPEEGGQIIADAVGSPLEEFQIAFEGVLVFDLKENAVELSGNFQETFITVAEIMQSLNPDEITEIPDPQEAFAVGYLEAYLPAE